MLQDADFVTADLKTRVPCAAGDAVWRAHLLLAVASATDWQHRGALTALRVTNGR